MNIMKDQPINELKQSSATYMYWFRIIFTIFSLFIMGDAFYRWDAFKFHSTFSEYLPNVALAFIVWNIVGLITSIILWLPIKIVERISGLSGVKIKAEHLILYLFVFIVMAAMALAGKKIIWADFQTSFKLKLGVLSFLACAAIPLTWWLRDRAGTWLNAVNERITPLVWLFSLCIILSVLLVGFTKLGANTDTLASQGITESAVSEQDKKRPNILYLSFDALTARNMSVYGYSRDTTPFMKKWAETASVFTTAEAESSYTAATTPSMMTGKRTWTHRKYHHDLAAQPLKSKTENIAQLLKESGYHSSAFIANSVAQTKALGMTGSFDYAPLYIELSEPASIEGLIDKYLFLLFGDSFSTYNWLGQDDFIFTLILRRLDIEIYVTELPPHLAFNKFLETVDNVSNKPFFAWVHIMPPHEPYSPPEPFIGTYNSSWELREKNVMKSVNPEIVKYKNLSLFPDFPEPLIEKIKLLSDYYDEFILYCDKEFETFIGELQKREWMDNTVIIISADHGESFYQHNYYQHGPPHLFEQVTNIPLIIKEPGQAEGRVLDDIVEQIDIPATILEFADVPAPSWMEGRSLMPLLRDQPLPSKTAISVSLYKNAPTEPITKGAIAVWQDDYKMVHYLEEKVTLLYNLKKDPEELDNLVTKEPDTTEHLLTVIRNNVSEANKKINAEK